MVIAAAGQGRAMDAAIAFRDFGAFVKDMRVKTGLTLQRFCAEFDYDPAAYSKMERGLASPPSGVKEQTKLAEDLCLWDGSNERSRLFSLAALCRGKLPPPGLSDEELVEQLPLVFRTVRGERLDEGKLMDFAQMFRSL